VRGDLRKRPRPDDHCSMPTEVVPSEGAATTRTLPAPAVEDDLALWPITDARMRPQGFLADVDVRSGMRPQHLAEALARFSARWRQLTGATPELHLRIAGVPEREGDDDLAASLAPLRATGRVVVWRPGLHDAAGGPGGWRVDDAASARPGSQADTPPPPSVPRMLRAHAVSSAPDARNGSQVVLTDVDDPARLRAARRRRTWRLVGTAVGGPDTADGWCWWAVGLGLGGGATGIRRPRRTRSARRGRRALAS
jgi:hypothetical protein